MKPTVFDIEDVKQSIVGYLFYYFNRKWIGMSGVVLTPKTLSQEVLSNKYPRPLVTKAMQEMGYELYDDEKEPYFFISRQDLKN